jgi:bifunctional enzyme CysN/CysC
MNTTMNIVVVGHVDHGKSTVVGRMLADTGSLPEGKLEQIKSNCERNSKPFEYAFLIDALKDEQSQGITIDVARVFFKTDKRNYIIIDAPGHIEFLKNMITGASRAESALLVIDADEGVRENSRRHGYMLSMLGIKQVSIIVNKMDLVNYSQKVFEDIRKEYTEFLSNINVIPDSFIPVSGMNGDNIASLSENMIWYRENTVVKQLDSFFKEKDDIHKEFRMPVQDVYKFTRFGDNRRIIAGTPVSGKASEGDEIVFMPSGKKSLLKSIELFNAKKENLIERSQHAAFTLMEQIYITRGEIACKQGERLPHVSKRFEVSLFWLGRKPMIIGKEYFIKIGTAKIGVKLESVKRIIDASDLSTKEKNKIERHDVCECIFRTKKPVAYDLFIENPYTSRFVIVDDFEISGGGIITRSLSDDEKWVRDKVTIRNFKWHKSDISQNERAEKYSQRPTLILISGNKDSGKKPLAKSLEKKLFNDGRKVYFVGIGNILYGVDADIKNTGEDSKEHIRRMSEIVHILLDSGMIVILTATGITADEIELLHTSVDPDKIELVWIGDEPDNIEADIVVDSNFIIENEVVRIKSHLEEKGIIFRTW